MEKAQERQQNSTNTYRRPVDIEPRDSAYITTKN
jgi:hypothetical protein